MGPKIFFEPEGKGSELDYDNYSLKKDQKYESADAWWSSFASLFSENWVRCDFKDELVGLTNGDVQLAMVIFAFAGENSINWFKNKRLEDLGWLTAQECVQSMFGMKRLRMLLMSAHY